MMSDSNAKQLLHASQDSIDKTSQDLQEQLRQMQSQLRQLEKTVSALEAKLQSLTGRYVAVCTNCRTSFDMLAHHYSIGLFDNLVYVKCPKCHRTLPVKGGGGGEIKIVEE
ncbi:MAG: hypothetical protein HY204_02660 [Nitrospirae bacterium]|nr:hypothetical protein [Nitrospirota bacterium]